MFSPDVISLRQFYATPLGARVQKFIAQTIENLWPEIKGDSLLAVGYALPYIEHYKSGATPLMVCMPAAQGAAAWPEGNNLVVLSHESELPFQQNSLNRVLLIHSIEHSEQLSGFISEIWRVLVPGGRVLAIVPHRMSFWSGSPHSPFGFGRPFSHSQLRTLFAEHQLTITRTRSALFAPPFVAKVWAKLARHIESIGGFSGFFFGGVIIVEAEKQIYAAVKQAPMRKNYAILTPAAEPAMNRDMRS
jgi:SAM-dependent methyltransferase